MIKSDELGLFYSPPIEFDAPREYPYPSGDGPSACSYYAKQCEQSGGGCEKDNYACAAKKCCESFGNNRASNCTRTCLINYDKSDCNKKSGEARDQCRKWAHVKCYSKCGNVGDAYAGRFGLNVTPACKAADNALGGVWPSSF